MARAIRLDVNVEVRPAVARDLPSLATWSGQVKDVFTPAVDADDRVLLVALANGGFTIGHVLVDLHGIISHLLVLRGFRDQGLGTALIDEAERALREAGSQHATLLVEKVNDGAIRLYERLGYTRTGESIETWGEPMADETMQPVGHPSWVMKKEF